MSKGDKLIYNTLCSLKEYCEDRSNCKGCDFCIVEGDNYGVEGSNYRCILAKLFNELSMSPYMYNMDEIGRLLEEYDIQKDN